MQFPNRSPPSPPPPPIKTGCFSNGMGGEKKKIKRESIRSTQNVVRFERILRNPAQNNGFEDVRLFKKPTNTRRKDFTSSNPSAVLARFLGGNRF